MTRPGVTEELLSAHASGDYARVERLFPAFYDELRRLAHRQLGPAGRHGDRTLNTTALVHEAFLKLENGARAPVADRGHFFALAARAMRQIIVDEARRHRASKRGDGLRRTRFQEDVVAIDTDAAQLLAIDEALSRLDARDARLARIVECRFFAGLSMAETAEALDISLRTAHRDWLRARAWLREELA